jgi:hypothetical protein
MVLHLGLDTLVAFWRTRLLWLERTIAANPHASFRLRAERRVLAFCLRRYAEGPAADAPAQAEPLDAESAQRSRRLWLDPELQAKLRVANPLLDEFFITLYRPVGAEEMSLIARSYFRKFPPCRREQPYFCPVLDREYAERIARDWNNPDQRVGMIGYVLAFDVPAVYVAKFDVHAFGNSKCRELWVPAEKVCEFNAQICGAIRVVGTYRPPGM